MNDISNTDKATAPMRGANMSGAGQPLASLWIGDRLGDIELASIWSFRRFGHPVTVYSYQPIENLPDGVVACHAAEVMPADRILRYWANGNPAIHADLFRYAMLAKTDNLWVDLDMIALRPFVFPSPWIFAMEDEAQINNAVLGLPKDSKTLAELVKMRLDTRGVPPHLTGRRLWKYRLRALLTGGVPISRWPWASTGPRAVTLHARQTGEIAHALPVEAFYAVPHRDARRFLDPADRVEDSLPEGVWGLHLWGGQVRQLIRKEFDGQIPAGSFLGRYVEMSRSAA